MAVGHWGEMFESYYNRVKNYNNMNSKHTLTTTVHTLKPINIIQVPRYMMFTMGTNYFTTSQLNNPTIPA
jgi:hypothetical protein